MLLSFGYLAGIFSETNKVSLLLQGKQLTVVFASDKILALKHKLEFWKACIHHCELDSVPKLKDVSNKMDGYRNKCVAFLML